MANAGFWATLCARNPMPAMATNPISTKNPTTPSRIQTIGLVFLGATETGAIEPGDGATAVRGGGPETGFPHCTQKLLLVTSAPQPAQNGIRPPINTESPVPRIRQSG